MATRSKASAAKADQVEALKAALAAITDDEIVHDDSVTVGDKFVIPKGMGYTKAIAFLQRKHEEDESEAIFQRVYNYRPYDGAYATSQVLRERFGITIGVPIATMFGKQPPQLIDVQISPTEFVQVPWGLMAVPGWNKTEVYTTAEMSEDHGMVFKILCKGPRKYRREFEEFFTQVQEYLDEHSIYRGQAVIGYENPEFLDLRSFRPESVIYAEDVRRILDSVLWSAIRFTEGMRRDDIPRKRAVLLHGPYGTGKTLAGTLTATIAVENGWTFITARPGRDDLLDVLRTARIYQPAVVFFEDIDGIASTSEDNTLSELLDAYDGITAKGGELVIVMTTNHISRIHKAMLRPGRLDALVEIAQLDRNGVEALVRAATPDGKMGDNVDFDKVYESMEGFFPAFVREVVNRASSVALARVDGRPGYTVQTEDLITAALSLRPQLEYMEDAKEGEVKPEIETAMRGLIRSSLHESRVTRDDGWEAVLETTPTNGR